MIPLSDIYILLPAFNEGSSIGNVVKQLQHQGFVNIVVVNDGSSDDTAQRTRELSVHLVNHPINRGAGAAVQTGIEIARKKGWQHLALMDADGQHDARDIICLKEKMEESGCDIVIGSRFMKQKNEVPVIRVVFNFIANLMTNLFCKQHYTDSQSGLRLLNRRAIESINLEIDGFGFCSGMLIKAEKAGLKMAETPTRVIYTSYSIRKGQDLHIGINTAFNFLWNTIFK